MSDSTTSQLNDHEIGGSRHLTEWWRLDAAIEKLKTIASSMSVHKTEENRTIDVGGNVVSARESCRNSSPDLSGAHGFVFSVETLGKGGGAVLIAGVLVAALLAGMAYIKCQGLQDLLNDERTRHQAAEAELRSRFESTNTEARMAEYYILELDGKLMAGGFIPPSRGYGQWKKEHRK